MVSLGSVPPLSFVVECKATVIASGYEVMRELCVGADTVSAARELFAEYVAQASDDRVRFELAGDVMNTFEQFGNFVFARECK